MILLNHIANQLHPEILVSHLSKFSIRIPTGASTSAWLMPFALVLVAIIWIGRVAILVVFVLLLIVVSIFQWRIAPRREEATDIDPEPRRLILVLRPFGADGRLVLRPQILASASSAIPRTQLIEKVIGDSARQVGAQPIALMDQNRMLVPRGVEYMPLGDDWFEHVRRMARQAVAVVVIAPPEESLRDGLKKELQLLASEGLERKTILVAPPGRDFHSDRVVTEAAKTFGWVPPSRVNPLLMYWSNGEPVTVGSLGPDDPFQLEVCKQELRRALRVVTRAA